MPVCPAEGCRLSIKEGDPTMEISVGTLQRGKKTGGFYHSKTYETKILIHYSCVFKFFHPQADATMHDEFRKLVEEDIKTEMLDDLKQAAMADAAEDLQNLCAECRDYKNHPDRPPLDDDVECPHCGATCSPVCGSCGEVRDNHLTEAKDEPQDRPTLPQPSRQFRPPFYGG